MGYRFFGLCGNLQGMQALICVSELFMQCTVDLIVDRGGKSDVTLRDGVHVAHHPPVLYLQVATNLQYTVLSDLDKFSYNEYEAIPNNFSPTTTRSP